MKLLEKLSKEYSIIISEVKILKTNMKGDKAIYKRDIKCLQSKYDHEANKLVDQKILNKV